MARNARAYMVDRLELESDRTAGACKLVYYADNPSVPAGVRHACPCGCRGLSAMWFTGMGRGGPEWTVTGEWPNVTMTPSIGIRCGADFDTRPDGFHWHGYLTNGVFEECA